MKPGGLGHPGTVGALSPGNGRKVPPRPRASGYVGDSRAALECPLRPVVLTGPCKSHLPGPRGMPSARFNHQETPPDRSSSRGMANSLKHRLSRGAWRHLLSPWPSQGWLKASWGFELGLCGTQEPCVLGRGTGGTAQGTGLGRPGAEPAEPWVLCAPQTCRFCAGSWGGGAGGRSSLGLDSGLK